LFLRDSPQRTQRKPTAKRVNRPDGRPLQGRRSGRAGAGAEGEEGHD
jgi:hypothetical protein